MPFDLVMNYAHRIPNQKDQEMLIVFVENTGTLCPTSMDPAILTELVGIFAQCAVHELSIFFLEWPLLCQTLKLPLGGIRS